MNTIKQFEDKHLSHYSYAILNEGEIILVDPARNPQPYYDFAEDNNAKIVGVIETHPHADFVSSHLETHQTTGATLYTHSLTGVKYSHQIFDDGDSISLGNIKLKSLHTPGHSPDSISVVLEQDGIDKAVFTGDTLFIGDCGRPDLREGTGNLKAKREELAKQMYHSLRNKLMSLNDNVVVYPAHGAGTLCGKALSEANSSTIGDEKASNWSLQELSEEEFILQLIADQPFIPKYFGFDVELNRNGAPAFQRSISDIKVVENFSEDILDPNILIIDARPEAEFKNAHLPNSFNIQSGNKFETWLGSIINPGEKFYLASNNTQELHRLIERASSIGYEQFIEAAFINKSGTSTSEKLNLEDFQENPDNYTIIDIRNISETEANPIFSKAISIPLGSLRENIASIPTHQPIMVHCAGGYRSAAGSSILNQAFGSKVKVYDLSEEIHKFI